MWRSKSDNSYDLFGYSSTNKLQYGLGAFSPYVDMLTSGSITGLGFETLIDTRGGLSLTPRRVTSYMDNFVHYFDPLYNPEMLPSRGSTQFTNGLISFMMIMNAYRVQNEQAYFSWATNNNDLLLNLMTFYNDSQLPGYNTIGRTIFSQLNGRNKFRVKAKSSIKEKTDKKKDDDDDDDDEPNITWEMPDGLLYENSIFLGGRKVGVNRNFGY